MEQRWLSSTGICSALGISPNILRILVKQKLIVKIGKNPNIRYLDPTPEYAEQLRLGQTLHAQEYLRFRDSLSSAALLTLREVAEIMGWTIEYARLYFNKKKIPAIQVGQYHLYSVEQVRDFLYARQDRRGAIRSRGKFLLREMIDYFWRYYGIECEETPTDSEFAEDDLLQRKLAKMMKTPSPQRELMLADFMAKIQFAKEVVAAAKTEEAPQKDASL